MGEIKDKVLDVCASLWYKPATVEEMSRRMKISEYGMTALIRIAEQREYIYEKGETWYCYMKTVNKVLNPAGYGIEIVKENKSE